MIKRQKLNGLVVDYRKRDSTVDITRRPHGTELAPLPSTSSVLELLEERNDNPETSEPQGTGSNP